MIAFIQTRYKVIIECLFLILVFYFANIRAFIVSDLYPTVDGIYARAWREVIFWLIAVLFMVYLIKWGNLKNQYLQLWRLQPGLVVFVSFSLVSVIWSTSSLVTLHRSLVFFLASCVAVYIGTKYSILQLMKILFYFSLSVMVMSFLFIWLLPMGGTDTNPPYNGAWRGIFWHKNHFGNILPVFVLVYLMLFFSPKIKKDSLVRIGSVFLYFASLVAAFYSKSASGWMVMFLLHVGFLSLFVWIRIRHALRPVHYYYLLFFVFILLFGVLLNIDFIFGLFGKNVSLTGRIPMWGILFREVFPLRPWFGSGFGTIWADRDFRIYMRDLAGWGYPIMIGDNGFIDILLNLGLVGLVLFLIYYLKIWINIVRNLLKPIEIEGYFPVLLLFITFLANLTFSLFFETEVFVWILMVAVSTIILKEIVLLDKKDKTYVNK